MLFVLVLLVHVLLVLMGLVKVYFIVNSYEESPVSLIFDVRNTILDGFPKKNPPVMLDISMYFFAHYD